MELKKRMYIRMLVCMLLVTALTGCGKNSENDDFLTGTWTLTSMKYDGNTYTKQEIEDAGAGITLELFKDGTGTMLHDGTSTKLNWDAKEIHTEAGRDTYVFKDGVLIVYEETTEMYFEKTQGTSSKNEKAVEDNWEVIELPSSLDLVPYSCVDFNMNIPKGWVVEEAPTYAGMFHILRVYDPNNPINQIVMMPKAEPFFPSDDVRQIFGMNNAIYGLCPVLSNVSTQGVFEVFTQYVTALEANEVYNSVSLPHIENFNVLESFASNSNLSSVSVSSEVLRATFTQNGVEGEGMFTADVVPFALELGTGYYMIYNLCFITAAKDDFQNLANALNKSLGSLEYSDVFVSSAMNQSDQQVVTSQNLSRIASETSDMIMSSWENRNASFDIMSQKQSDATMGYERIQDTQTGEIIKIDNGFIGNYDGTRYTQITDAQYAEPVDKVVHIK